MSSVPDWDTYWMTLVYVVASRSKDVNTHVGAVVVGPDNEVRSTGYNSFPRGVEDLPGRQIRPGKYTWFEHAERNAIYNAARTGVSLKGCIMYTPGLPCVDCARAVIQAGITEVVLDKAWGAADKREEWKDSHAAATQLFCEANIKYREWEGTLIMPVRFQRGQEL